MKIEILFDYPLRGTILEHAARIILRRTHKNNFIFCCNQFDSIDELTIKYRLNTENVAELVVYLRKEGIHTDLIEFVLEDKITRKIVKINFYDVKSKIFNAIQDYYEMCLSEYHFVTHARSLGCGIFIIPIIVYSKWEIDFTVCDMQDVPVRIYDSTIKKTVLFDRQNTTDMGT